MNVSPKAWHEGKFKMHFVKEIIDGEYTMIVYKYYFKSRKRWNYKCEPKWLVDFVIEQEDKNDNPN